VRGRLTDFEQRILVRNPHLAQRTMNQDFRLLWTVHVRDIGGQLWQHFEDEEEIKLNRGCGGRPFEKLQLEVAQTSSCEVVTYRMLSSQQTQSP
jgi:hypothetical protein